MYNITWVLVMKYLKRILSILAKDKLNMLMTIFLIVIETAFELFIPFLMKDIINKGIKNNDMMAIIYSGGLIVICAIASLVFGHFYARFNARLVSNFSYKLRSDVYKKIQEYSFSNLDHFDISSLVTRATNDVQVLQNAISGSVRPFVRSPILLFMGIALVFVMSPDLGWIFLVVVPILALILFVIIKKVSPTYQILQDNIDELNQVVRENVTAIRTVKSFVREDYESEKFKNKNVNVYNTTKHTFSIATLNQPFFQLSMYSVTVMLISFGSIMVHNNTLEVGTLSALLSYVLQVINSIMMLSNVFILMNRSFASSKRIVEILDEKIDITSTNNRHVSVGDIEFKNVSFKYKNTSNEYALSNINLKIPHGSSVGIMGGTGSAKSTLSSLILRLYDVTDGEVLIDNINVKDYDLINLRDSISIVLQNNVLFTGTIKENLLWGNKNATDDEIKWALKVSRSDEFVYKLDKKLDYIISQGGTNVSGGQRQRLCIARALLKKPKIIIFDDSTSACDMKTEREILQGIRKLENVTNIIIGQRVNAVKDCDFIIILDDGKINSIGSHDELYKSSRIYKELCDSQLGGMKNEE